MGSFSKGFSLKHLNIIANHLIIQKGAKLHYIPCNYVYISDTYEP